MQQLVEKHEPLKFGSYLKKKQFCLQQQFKTHPSDIFSLRFDFDDQAFAIGMADGSVQIFIDGQHKHRFETMYSPVTALRWRPNFNNKAKSILVSANAEGEIIHWHALSGKKLHVIREEDNSTLCLDFNFDGSLFATGGKDFCIRIYDDDIKSVQHIFHQADWGQRGHANRVFAVKFLPEQNNVLISGGWDANILIWDVREKSCIGQFYGPSLAGDALDYAIKSQLILTGSHRTDHQLQLWDFRTRKLFKEVEWTGNQCDENKSYYIYAAQFNKMDENYFYAGSGGVHEIKMFDINAGQPVGSVIDLPKSVLTLDQMNLSDCVGFSGMEGIINIIKQ